MIARSPFQDYRAPAFYMVTITAYERRPHFAVCKNNLSTLTPDGWLVYSHWQRIAQDYPQIAVSTLCIMPDHLHGILHVTERMEKPMGVAIRAFKSQCTSAFRQKHGNPAFILWNPGYNDRCVWRRGTLPAFTHYIMDNPRRYCLKKKHPDLFRSVANIKHPVIPADQSWDGYGNRFLLDRPEKCAIRVSRKATPSEISTMRDKIIAEAAQGVVMVSPFISPGEREISKAILAAPVGDVILIKPDDFPPFYKPHGYYFDLCVQGRLLILSSDSLRFHENKGSNTLTRATCLSMNKACSQIAQTAFYTPAEAEN